MATNRMFDKQPSPSTSPTYPFGLVEQNIETYCRIRDNSFDLGGISVSRQRTVPSVVTVVEGIKGEPLGYDVGVVQRVSLQPSKPWTPHSDVMLELTRNRHV
ncbi:hypothetical protein D3C87_1511080 [compost metagenome]